MRCPSKLCFGLIPILTIFLFSCNTSREYSLDEKTLSSLGSGVSSYFEQEVIKHKKTLLTDSLNRDALYAIAENEIILHIFGYKSRNESIPVAKNSFHQLWALDSISSESWRLKAMLDYLDWNWTAAEEGFLKSIRKNPENLSARHWYSLYLASMMRTDEAMLQHDTIKLWDENEDFLIGRGSIFYFQERYEDLKQLMNLAIAKDTLVPWPYDWQGMAFNGLEEHDMALKTYFKAFELSDGTVEVGAGLGHALGDAGEISLAKQMADFYEKRAEKDYLPYCQRSFIHISIDEFDKALDLLETAYKERSWFLIFMQIEPWYNPIREDDRFQNIMKKMDYPAFQQE